MMALTLYNHDMKQDVGDSFEPQTMTRHKDFRLCGIGWTVMMEFVLHHGLGMCSCKSSGFRVHVFLVLLPTFAGQPLPPVDQGKAQWYGWKLMRKEPDDPETPISYDAMRNAAIAANKAAGITGHCPTHQGRKTGAMWQKMEVGTSNEELHYMGHWLHSVGSDNYIRVVSPGALAGNAGFPSHDVYFIERGGMLFLSIALEAI
jgi:hypothetical protein